MALTDKQVEEIISTAMGFDRVRAETGLSEADLKEALLDANVEQCPHCKWFTECHNLLDDDDDVVDGYCDNCRKYDKPKTKE